MNRWRKIGRGNLRWRGGEAAAFSLLELLVVIVIIVILAALLLPSLSAARRKAREIACRNNARQLCIVAFTYRDEQGSFLLCNDPQYPGRGMWKATLSGLLKNPNICLCPVAPLRQPTPESGNRMGTTDQAWVRWTMDARQMLFASYGLNAWLCPDLATQFPHPPGFVFTKEDRIQSPALTPVFVDANWAGLSPFEADGPWRNLYTGAPFGVPGENMGRCAIARHSIRSPTSAPRVFAQNQKMPGAITAGFADGHCRLVALEDLWTLSWHAGWQTPATRPGLGQ
jgi:prepilin-type N-terminal cleavage/methylation domain-containing protein